MSVNDAEDKLRAAENRIDILENSINVQRLDNQRLQEIVFALSARIADLELHQDTLRNVMARMAQKLESDFVQKVKPDAVDKLEQDIMSKIKAAPLKSIMSI